MTTLMLLIIYNDNNDAHVGISTGLGTAASFKVGAQKGRCNGGDKPVKHGTLQV